MKNVFKTLRCAAADLLLGGTEFSRKKWYAIAYDLDGKTYVVHKKRNSSVACYTSHKDCCIAIDANERKNGRKVIDGSREVEFYPALYAMDAIELTEEVSGSMYAAAMTENDISSVLMYTCSYENLSRELPAIFLFFELDGAMEAVAEARASKSFTASQRLHPVKLAVELKEKLKRI